MEDMVGVDMIVVDADDTDAQVDWWDGASYAIIPSEDAAKLMSVLLAAWPQNPIVSS